MSEQITTEYKGFTITYLEFNESWSCEITGKKTYEKEKLADVKKRIDAFIKAESEFKSVDVLLLEDSYGYTASNYGKVATITSVTDSGDVWLNLKGNRSKVSKKYIGKITPENKDRLMWIATLQNEIKTRQESIAKFKSEMDLMFTETD